MKHINNAILRSIFSIALGLVLILWPEAAIHYLVMTIGVLFMIPGIISLINYLTRDKSAGAYSAMFPIDGVGSLLLGGWLMLMPGFFVNILMYVLGAVLVIAGIQQWAVLLRARRWGRVAFSFYILPTLILLTGVMIICNPAAIAANTFIIFGVAILIYGANELLNWYKFRKHDYIQLD